MVTLPQALHRGAVDAAMLSAIIVGGIERVLYALYDSASDQLGLVQTLAQTLATCMRTLTPHSDIYDFASQFHLAAPVAFQAAISTEFQQHFGARPEDPLQFLGRMKCCCSVRVAPEFQLDNLSEIGDEAFSDISGMNTNFSELGFSSISAVQATPLEPF
eukprot:TRINITY_DN5059_c0_g2_i1.p1 TRINITY_DN5059_c0_g2~~TRINITY_DN5059_c0_g2_i1.p1  ORF type:complete len:160 (+),score=38.61 TRINITY_DN5059_c0_g2_i1:201-680(+)